MNGLLSDFTTKEKLSQLWHGYVTCLKITLNHPAAAFAPRNWYLSSSYSLKTRVCITMGGNSFRKTKET